MGALGAETLPESCRTGLHPYKYLEHIRAVLGMPAPNDPSFAAHVPFAGKDATAGVENEIQTAVIGSGDTADLPLAIRGSGYYQNLLRRTTSGDCSRKLIQGLSEYLEGNREGVWENSWVRFDGNLLNDYARELFMHDLSADKADPESPFRSDRHRFLVEKGNCCEARIPVSYLLKLALADAVGEGELPEELRSIAESFMGHFSNDNTSPETYSFYPVVIQGSGAPVVKETAKRFLLCRLLAGYANEKFKLSITGQETAVYFSPNPPWRQRRLNELISDAFYRELYMSPCLSGWNKGEEKYRYMIKCHEVLSRSRLGALRKLKEAQIIVNNLVVLPDVSNVSLANNGTHVSLGSRKLSRLLSDKDSGFDPVAEKYLGDLSIKIMEHFLPLFVGTYSAAPYRLAFEDFHPEKALGFLPHELDYTHLRMLWRRWKKKASLRFFGRPLTPFGPEWLDRRLGKIFGLKGDLVPDHRLMDYFVSVMSTDRHSALSGELGNEEGLKKDLASLGEFDAGMALYLPFRLRQFGKMGFSGFEGRYYSLFESLSEDMGSAVALQRLLAALAYQYALSGTVAHEDIPDDPTVESERRQIFFGAALGLPTFFVHGETKNRFLLKILHYAKNTRPSNRYPGYLRVHQSEYRLALLKILREEGADLIRVNDADSLLTDLEQRLKEPEKYSAAGKLTRRIMAGFGTSDPLKIDAEDFNLRAEKLYREDLSERETEKAFEMLLEDLRRIQGSVSEDDPLFPGKVTPGESPCMLVEAGRRAFGENRASADQIRKLILLCVLSIAHDRNDAAQEASI